MIARILDDKYLHAANLLICAGTLATPVGAIAAGNAVVAGALSLKEIAKRLRPAEKNMANQIATLLKAQADKQTHLTGDTAISLPDMVVAGMPSAQTIIETKQQTKPLVNAMVAHLGTLGQPDYELSQNITAFRAVLTPVFETLLNDPAFTAHLAPQRERILLEIPDMLGELKSTADETLSLVRAQQTNAMQLDNIMSLNSEALQNLAARFEIDNCFTLPDAVLRKELTLRADEFRALKSEVDAIPDTMRALANLKSAAQDAIDRVDLKEVEHLMAMVHEAELDEAAKSAEIRANTALLRGKVEDAYRYLSATADSFGAVDPAAPARKRLEYEDTLYAHGLRYGSTGMIHAATMNRDAIAMLDRDAQGTLWAQAQNNLAIALRNQGTRTDGAEGAALLAEAVTAYRNALKVLTRADYPVDWATTQNNLGAALRNQGTRTDGAKGAALLAGAVTAYRDALKVRTRADHPVQWAMTQNNLGGALQNQGIRTDGAEGAALLAEAVTAFRDALKVRTRADHPVQWAMTQENIASCELGRAAHDSCTDPRAPLLAAVQAVDNALTVYDPVYLSYDHATATRLRDEIQAALDALPPA